MLSQKIVILLIFYRMRLVFLTIIIICRNGQIKEQNLVRVIRNVGGRRHVYAMAMLCLYSFARCARIASARPTLPIWRIGSEGKDVSRLF